MILLVLINCIELKADVQWADSVISFSSQRSEREFSAKQALGKPSVSPEFGFTPCAWSPSQELNTDLEWIEVSFRSPIKIRQIIINEVYNPGAIKLITGFNKKGVSEVFYENNKLRYIGDNGRTFRVFLERESIIEVSSLKIELETRKVPGFSLIDAIGISNSENPVDISINNLKTEVILSEKENLGENVNSFSAEIIPIISSDGRTLIFSRLNHPENLGSDKRSDVWISEIDENGNFGPSKNIGEPVNNESTNFALSLSQDGNQLLLGNRYNQDGSMEKGLSVSYRIGSSWSFPEPLEIENFTNLNKRSSYSFGPEGKTLFMAIETEDSYGGLDLYVSQLNPNRTWSEPLNLGPNINSAADEGTPFMSSDGKTLFFSSSGFPGYGGPDLFYSKKLDANWKLWSTPLNLGPNINSDGWDLYFTIAAEGKEAFFVSTDNSLGSDDIFKIKLPVEYKPGNVALLNGTVRNANTMDPISAKIIYERLSDGKELGEARSNAKTGDFKITLPEGEKYAILAEAEGYISITQNIDLKKINEYSNQTINLLLAPIQIGQTVQLNNIFFETGSSELRSESHSELNRVIRLLNKYPKLKIEISGHTDDVGSSENNMKLSKERAQSVSDYLIQNGIPSSRIVTVGWGELKPIDYAKTAKARERNRRVEFKILE